jgi:hypothetical protein
MMGLKQVGIVSCTMRTVLKRPIGRNKVGYAEVTTDIRQHYYTMNRKRDQISE